MKNPPYSPHLSTCDFFKFRHFSFPRRESSLNYSYLKRNTATYFRITTSTTFLGTAEHSECYPCNRPWIKLPTAAARVRARVWSCGICGGQSGAGAGFLRVLRFPLPIFIPPNYSSSQSPTAGTTDQLVANVPSEFGLHPLCELKKKHAEETHRVVRCRGSQIIQTIGSRMALRLFASRAHRPLPPERFVVLISVRGCVTTRAIVRLEGLGELKYLMISSGIKPATLRLVAQCPNVYSVS
jgi:hypothetical protein